MDSNKGWLSISTQGFASMNSARPPEHLFKELLQNALDSIDIEKSGIIQLMFSLQSERFFIECRDNGSGIEDLSDLRVLYLTHKTDSHLKRGRFGRGFKEALCVAKCASVVSNSSQIEFFYEQGEPVSKKFDLASENHITGTVVRMEMPWTEDVISKLNSYFGTFLIPKHISLLVNGKPIHSRDSKSFVEASLPTEIYDYQTQSWKKPTRKTVIRLIPTQDAEKPKIYEMGIPVAEIEWNVPFHCDIQQRVPMNPNRDAVSSGYALKLQTACLPTLLEIMTPAEVRQDWVGSAGIKCEPKIQKQIIEKGFGAKIALSVPKRGKRQFDEDARDLGVEIINTQQTSGGFRHMLRAHIPTAENIVIQDEKTKAKEAIVQGFKPDELPTEENQDERNLWIEKQGGKKRVSRCLDFAVWFCQQLINSYSSSLLPVTGKLALGKNQFVAHWSSDNELTLALDVDYLWIEPLGAKSLEVLIHEAAHTMNMHHGREFRKEAERLAGVAANLIFTHGSLIRDKWTDLIS